MNRRNPADEAVTALHGAGGELMHRLVTERILPRFSLKAAGPVGLDALDDGAALELPPGVPVVTTDSHVVKPIFFPGGDIGRLAACGTINDLAVMGARPVAMTLALILEEGFPFAALERILFSLAEVLSGLGVALITGDTKVMGRGELDGIAVNTTGIGVARALVSDAGLRPGDAMLVTGPVGDHGFALLAAREDFHLDSSLSSDVTPIWPLVDRALAVGGITAMKDPTRGGLAAALNEMAAKADVCIELQEQAIPVRGSVRGLAELLGISPYEVACEGRALIGVAPQAVEGVLAALRGHPLGREAAVIGRVTQAYRGKVVLDTGVGGRRFLEPPLGDPVPRIC
ncbi:MAG: hydrogenase expression/formation protein HypE [Candidatus Bipolaricaulaceae bacterium]